LQAWAGGVTVVKARAKIPAAMPKPAFIFRSLKPIDIMELLNITLNRGLVFIFAIFTVGPPDYCQVFPFE
jgi:hypothetical protein